MGKNGQAIRYYRAYILVEEKGDKEIIINAMEVSRADQGRREDRVVAIVDSVLK